MTKKLILVTSPPACGKTHVSKQIAKRLKHVVYLDKDTLICLSKQIFKVAGEPYNRSSRFFQENIRDYEYEAIISLAMEALDYDDIVLINAPFTKEVRDPYYIRNLRAKLTSKGAELIIIWVETSIEVCRRRMLDRNSDRDIWKLANWNEYISGCNFDIPTTLDDPDVSNELLIFKNSNEWEYEESIKRIINVLEEDRQLVHQ